MGHAQDAPPAPPTSVDASGKATITIDMNGHKETRVVDLGKAASLLRQTADPSAPKPRHVWMGVIADQVSPDCARNFPCRTAPASRCTR